MKAHPILIDGNWQTDADAEDFFQAHNPESGEKLDDQFPVSAKKTIDLALKSGKKAARQMAGISSESIAEFLDLYAAELESKTDELAHQAHLETGLAIEPRLKGIEIPRMILQLRQAADTIREGSWQRATIDTSTNIRSRFEPMGGPVVIFGPNNFPFAFNAISGGDFAAAIAAGNPVIAKAHPCHPNTSRRLAEIAFHALCQSDLPNTSIQFLYHFSKENGLYLVGAPETAAAAFTGSRKAGMELKSAADSAGNPIYLEMSSLNPLFLLPGAVNERAGELVGELAGSCNLGGGQFCTKPGLIAFIDQPESRQLVDGLCKAFQDTAPPTLLAPTSMSQIADNLGKLTSKGAKILMGGEKLENVRGFHYPPTLLSVSAQTFLSDPDTLQTEVFGPVTLLVIARNESELLSVAERIEGNLTGTIYSHTDGSDDSLYGSLEAILGPKVGRILNDKVPTGVAVVSAMNHGGPFPSTGHPGFSAVGFPASLYRFTALKCYDAVRASRLPTSLKDENPNSRMWRLIDGEWTQKDASSSS